jgi:hypothetical protein
MHESNDDPTERQELEWKCGLLESSMQGNESSVYQQRRQLADAGMQSPGGFVAAICRESLRISQAKRMISMRQNELLG